MKSFHYLPLSQCRKAEEDVYINLKRRVLNKGDFSDGYIDYILFPRVFLL